MMRDDYFDWLLDKIDFNRRGYNDLMQTLFEIPFVIIIDRDKNRELDAMDLFYEYIDSRTSIYRSYISVLEILIALAIRIDNEYIGDPSDPNPEHIFWEMCCNLGLEKYTNRKFNYDSVRSIIEEWLYRDFDYDGEGSIFPIKDPIQDQRKIEIWSQMQEYLSENYS